MTTSMKGKNSKQNRYRQTNIYKYSIYTALMCNINENSKSEKKQLDMNIRAFGGFSNYYKLLRIIGQIQNPLDLERGFAVLKQTREYAQF